MLEEEFCEAGKVTTSSRIPTPWLFSASPRTIVAQLIRTTLLSPWLLPGNSVRCWDRKLSATDYGRPSPKSPFRETLALIHALHFEYWCERDGDTTIQGRGG